MTPDSCAPGNFPFTVRELAASPTVAGLYGVVFNEGRVAVTSDGEAAAPRWAISAPLPVTRPSGLAFPPAGSGPPGDVVVVSSDLPTPSAKGHLFRTRDRGLTWERFEGDGSGFDLPDFGIPVVRFDPTNPSTIYVGNDVGVYRTTDGGRTWRRYGQALPRVRVRDLFVARDGSLLRISTEGRGLWELRPRGSQTAFDSFRATAVASWLPPSPRAADPDLAPAPCTPPPDDDHDDD